MGDNRLTLWVDDRHLGLSAADIAASAARFAASHHLVLRQFLRPESAGRVARFLADEADFETRYGLYSARPKSVSEERWLAAEDDDRFYRHRQLAGVRTGCELSANLARFMKLRRYLYDAGLRHLFESLTGLTLGGLGPLTARRYEPGDYLRPHTDDTSGRQLAFVLYLAPDWRAEFGGALNIVDGNGTQVVIEAEFNSVVAFNVSAGDEHWVDAVTDAATGTSRLTLSGWYAKARGRRVEA